jgi:hypothetical protein
VARTCSGEQLRGRQSRNWGNKGMGVAHVECLSDGEVAGRPRVDGGGASAARGGRR